MNLQAFKNTDDSWGHGRGYVSVSLNESKYPLAERIPTWEPCWLITVYGAYEGPCANAIFWDKEEAMETFNKLLAMPKVNYADVHEDGHLEWI